MPGPIRTDHDVIVIGAGLHGLSSALHLARAGLSVLVLEKDYAGRHASGVNAGGVRRLGRHEAEIPLSLEACQFWHRIEKELGDACGFVPCGQVKVAESDVEARNLHSRRERLTALGYDHEEWLDAGQLRRLVPNISRRCVGAIVCRGDGSANPFRTVKAFRRAAEQAGAEFRDGHRVLGLEHTGSGWCVGTEFGVFRSERLVNCAGAWGNVIANLLGETVPLAPEAFMLMITERVAPFLGPVVGAAGRTLSFKQFDNGTLLIGGGHRGRADRSNNRTTLSVAGLRASARTVGELFPQLGGVRVVRCWAGIEGVTPDKLPVIGPSRRAEGAYHVFGFSGHGFQLAPVTGRIVTDWVLRGDSPLPIEAFAVDRFDPAASKDALAPATRRCGPRSATARSSS